jgi:hypothetical protein
MDHIMEMLIITVIKIYYGAHHRHSHYHSDNDHIMEHIMDTAITTIMIIAPWST